MKGSVIRFEGSAHAQAERLLPWWINGTLAGDERVQVEQHLAECAACQHEAAWLRTLQDEFSGDETAAVDAPHAMRRLCRRIATEAAARPVPTVSAWRRYGRRLAWLAAVQAVLILGLAVGLLHERRATYHTLGAPADQTALLVVTFDPQLSEARLRQLLLAGDARIVGGPTAAGAYLLRVPDVRAAAVRRMLHDSAGVTMVESLDAGAQP